MVKLIDLTGQNNRAVYINAVQVVEISPYGTDPEDGTNIVLTSGREVHVKETPGDVKAKIESLDWSGYVDFTGNH
jgi:hypothetical protein